VIAVIWAIRVSVPRLRRTLVATVVVVVAQIGIGLFQARNGLPELAVGIHMVLASVIVALVVSALLATREEVPAQG